MDEMEQTTEQEDVSSILGDLKGCISRLESALGGGSTEEGMEEEAEEGGTPVVSVGIGKRKPGGKIREALGI